MRDKLSNGIIAAVLGAVIAVSSVGCLISGFDLKVEQVPLVVMVAGLFAVLGAIFFSYRYGSFAMLGVLGMAALFFWQGGEAQTQTQALITRISYTYDQAYQWGVLRFPGAWYGVKADLTMLMLVTLITLAVTWVVCRRRSVIWAIIPAFVPLGVCFVVTDTTPNAACFFFWIVGLAVLLITSSARRRDPERSSGLTWMTSAAVLAATAVLFASMPQSEYRNPLASIQNQILEMMGFEGYGTGGGSGGEIEGVDLKGLGSRFFLQYPVMTVTAPEDGVVYLREQDFNVYTGYSWESDEERRDVLPTMPASGSKTLSLETRWFRAQLLVPYFTTEPLTLSDGRVKNTDSAQTYQWRVQSLPEDWKDTIPNETVTVELISSSIDPKYYHSLPADTQGWAQELLADILTDERSATAIADTVAAYVKMSAVYEDDCKRMPSSEQDFAKWFIEAGESGYCVHFATSTAVLLRTAGVNTRYVTGYMAQVKANEPTVITADLEHAWVEYYEPALDMWIPLESTPPEPEDIEQTETTAATTTTTTPFTQNTTMPTQPTQPDEAGVSILWREIAAVAGKVLLYALVAAAVIALVIGQRRWRSARRQKRWEKSSQNARALMLWRDIVRMTHHIGGAPPEVLYVLAQKAKYSQHTLTQAELQLLQDECEALETILRTRSWLTRFVHRYILRLY